MEAFETTLTGSDGSIDGIVTHISNEAYQFTSLDSALHLTIAKNTKGKWVRLSGSEPYFVGWVDELSESILAQAKHAPATTVKKAGTITAKAKTTAATPAVKKTKTASSVKKDTAEPQKIKKTTAKVATTQKGKVSSTASKK